MSISFTWVLYWIHIADIFLLCGLIFFSLMVPFDGVQFWWSAFYWYFLLQCFDILKSIFQSSITTILSFASFKDSHISLAFLFRFTVLLELISVCITRFRWRLIFPVVWVSDLRNIFWKTAFSIELTWCLSCIYSTTLIFLSLHKYTTVSWLL